MHDNEEIWEEKEAEKTKAGRVLLLNQGHGEDFFLLLFAAHATNPLRKYLTNLHEEPICIYLVCFCSLDLAKVFFLSSFFYSYSLLLKW